MYEHLAESQEEDIGKCQGNTDTDVPADTSTSLFRRKRNSHDCKDECREWEGETGILLDQSELHVGISSHFLGINEVVELIVVQGFYSLFCQIEVF